MNIIESLIYGLISGLTEFLPVSSFGHQSVMKKLFGAVGTEPIRDILIHIAVLLAILVSCGTYIEKLRRNKNAGRRGRRGKQIDNRAAYDLRIIKSAVIPMLLIMLFRGFAVGLSENLALVALFFVLNGFFIYIPEHLPHSNKDASQMSALDSILLGLCGALSVLPGFSRVGCSLSLAVARGADRSTALNWVLIISLPAVALLLVFDFISIFSVGIGVITFQIFIGYILSAIAAFAAACCGIYIMRFITLRSDISLFGYYCWGVAMLSFILYLMT